MTEVDLPRISEKPPDQAEPAHMVAARAWVAIRAVYRAHARLARLEGDHLEQLLRKRWYGRCGYGSFRDFVREELQFSPRTARRRVALSRLAKESPDLGAALDAGRLSPCQVLALSRLRDAPDLESWITMAEDCTVRDLDQLVSHYLLDLCSETDDETAREPLVFEPEERGRRFTFAAPLSAAVAWEHGLDMAQKVLGWDAPAYRAIEAVLEETAVDLACGEANSSIRNEASAKSGSASESFALLDPGDDFPFVEEIRTQLEPPPDLNVTPEQLEALQLAIQDAECELDAIGSIAHPCEHDPDLSIAALAHLRRKDRGLRLLLARLLRQADAANIFPFLGYRTVTNFLVSRLKLSDRTAARFMTESWTFEDNPELARAFTAGRIGLGQAYLVNRVAVTSTQAAFIRRAETVTHLHFEREVRFLERLADLVPSVAQQFHGPLPLPGLPAALIQRLRDLGWTEVRIDECVGSFDGDGDPSVDPVLVVEDPSVDPLLMGRLEGLLDLVALALEEHDVSLAGTLPTLATLADDSSSFIDTSAPLPTLATLEGHDPLPLRTTISFWAPESLITRWNTALAHVQTQHGPMPIWAAALFLMRRAVQEWQRVDPSRRPREWKVFERDEWRCRAPGCSARRHLEAHHIIFRSQNGSDDSENLITLCHAHHRRGIHEGYLRVEGTAPSALHWRLGGGKRRLDGTPRLVRYFQGSQHRPANHRGLENRPPK